MSIQNWPADRVERRPLDGLIPYARNARTHSDAQVAQIAASMKEWGWTNPVLVDEAGGIIAGHGRVLAARLLGFDEAPVMVAEGWTETQKQAYVLADNKLALNAGWDDDLLSLEIRDLLDSGFDVGLAGFSDEEIADLLNSDADVNVGIGAGALAEKFMIPPFSVLNAREGWWQERKAQWIGIGIRSELGRGEAGNEPGGSPRPACNYGDRKRGDGAGRPLSG